jgi:hypothetical protein
MNIIIRAFHGVALQMGPLPFYNLPKVKVRIPSTCLRTEDVPGIKLAGARGYYPYTSSALIKTA